MPATFCNGNFFLGPSRYSTFQGVNYLICEFNLITIGYWGNLFPLEQTMVNNSNTLSVMEKNLKPLPQTNKQIYRLNNQPLSALVVSPPVCLLIEFSDKTKFCDLSHDPKFQSLLSLTHTHHIHSPSTALALFTHTTGFK